jgi:hypothetical protein
MIGPRALKQNFYLLHCKPKIFKSEKDLVDRKILRFTNKYLKRNLADI